MLSLPRAVRALGIVVLASLTLSLAACDDALPIPSTSAPAGGPLTGSKIPISVLSDRGIRARPVVNVTVGNGQPVPMLLDSGSVGLRVFASSLGKDAVERTGDEVTANFGDGTVFSGVKGKAPVNVGGLASDGPINFQIVDRVSCTANGTSCPGINGESGYIAEQGVHGVLGIGLNAADIYSPLVQLQGGIPATFTVSINPKGGSIAFGTPPTTATAALGMRESSPSQQANGARAWNDQTIQGCWAFNDPSQSQCFNTLFDTGSVLTTVTQSVPGAPAPPAAPPGSTLTLATTAGSKPIWTSTAGAVDGKDQIRIVPSADAPLAVAGIEFFYTFNTTFDIVDGKVIFAANLAVSDFLNK